MSKLYQFTSIFIIILFFTGCGGSTPTKKETQNSDNSSASVVDPSKISSATTDEKIKYIETLFDSALSSKHPEKNTLLGNALVLSTQILMDSYQQEPSHEQSDFDISPEQYDYTQQLTHKIMALLDTNQLTHEQNNQYLLASAAISLTNYQIENALSQLNNDFDSVQNELWALYYQIQAVAKFQLGQTQKSI